MSRCTPAQTMRALECIPAVKQNRHLFKSLPVRVLLRLTCIGISTLALLSLTLLLATPARGDGGATPTPTPTVSKMADPDSWTRPPPPGPTQADHGAYTYWMRCMVCHGDQGQGLALFRSYYPKGDQNCANHKCHGGPQPGAGFSFPDAPAIMGTGTLVGFKTAADLYNFLSKRMPYQAPGELSSEEYWNLVAYLLKQRGALPGGVELNAATAALVLVNTSSEPGSVPIIVGAGAAALLAALFLLLRRYWRSRSAPSSTSQITDP